jgi:isoquinoline 1-oxidoreductase beta subunit
MSFSADSYFAEVMGEFEAAPRKFSGQLSRRSVLKLTGAAGAGLVLAFALTPSDAAAAPAVATKDFAPNAFLRVAPDGIITIISKGPEIGQGIKTAFPLIVAEEMDAAWADVRVEQAMINPAVYGRQSAGGSTSIPNAWDQLRTAGATARAMLISAAAKQWNVPASECTATDSAVIHSASKRSLTYAALAVQAAKLPVPDPDTLTLKTRAEYKLIGGRFTGVDNLAVVTGQPLFGIDHVVPGMLYAVYEKCPAVGGKVASANLDYIKTLPGVKDAFVLEGTGVTSEVMPGVAIIADSTWAAFKAKAALQVEWDESSASKDSWTNSVAQAKRIAKQAGAESIQKIGNVDEALKTAAKTVEAFYSYPFVSHATLEPQGCTAWFKGDEIELWVTSQTPERARSTVAQILSLPEEKVAMHQLRAGGGFGRRLVNDPVCEAAMIAQRVNAPVKLTWTREDDMRHDFYRPGGFHSFTAGLDAAGKLVAWRDHFVTFTSDGKSPVSGGNIAPTEFPAPLLANAEITQTMLPLKTPCGAWRAPRSNAIAFAVQSFIHELAVAAGRDHVEFLLEILGEPRWMPPQTRAALNTGRAADVVKLAAEKSGWGTPLPPGRGRGLAFHFSHAGHFAEVAEVSVDAQKRITVHKVTVAGDIGPIVNMSGAENQCEGGVVDGLSTMLNLQIGIENGRIQEGNFTEYPLLRMKDAPQVDVHFIQSDNPPTGVGEPALPPVAPAIANAVFAASGMRLRSMPFRNEGVTT